ncbi:MAG: hypothetical protein PVF59_07205 [Desulfobacterales bacterium]
MIPILIIVALKLGFAGYGGCRWFNMWGGQFTHVSSWRFDMRPCLLLFLLLGGIYFLSGPSFAGAADYQCPPTPPDSLGPFYKPNAPLRSSLGKGYLMTGTVKSAGDCTPISKAAIEFWLTNPEGHYDDQHRATVISDHSGDYRFESHRPTDYGFRPPHIHLRISAEGFKPLVTQHYPEEGTSKARFDIVLIPVD